MLRIGIDEAGYGPLLGPLVIGAVALRVEDEPGRTASDLRRRLGSVVARASEGARRAGSADGDAPVVLDDSKAVKERHGLAGLARGVRAFAAAAGHTPPADLGDLLARYGDRPAAAFAGEPWFAALAEEPVPPAPLPADLRARVLLTGVEPLGMVVAPALPAELNEAWAASDNKARVLFLAAAAVLVRLLEAFPGEDAEVLLDRQGGRLDYGDLLRDAFPFHDVERLRAPRGTSPYLLRHGGRRVRLTFQTRGDAEHLEVGWASMAAKLTRELFMARLNAWFGARQPGLRPTAGYVEDGRRWLREAAPVLSAQGIDPARLVRTR